MSSRIRDGLPDLITLARLPLAAAFPFVAQATGNRLNGKMVGIAAWPRILTSAEIGTLLSYSLNRRGIGS